MKKGMIFKNCETREVVYTCRYASGYLITILVYKHERIFLLQVQATSLVFDPVILNIFLLLACLVFVMSFYGWCTVPHQKEEWWLAYVICIQMHAPTINNDIVKLNAITL